MRNRDALLIMFERTVAVWPATVPMEYVDRDMRTCRLNNSPENAGHRQGFLAVVALQGRVFVRLLQETNQYLRENKPPFLKIQKPSGNMQPGIGNGPNGCTLCGMADIPENSFLFQGRRSGQLFAGVWGNSRTLSGEERLESNRKCLSVNKGTGEARSSKVVAWIGCLRTVESLPMRRPSGGAPVVVRGRENRPHGEGVQDVSFWITERFTTGRVSNER